MALWSVVVFFRECATPHFHLTSRYMWHCTWCVLSGFPHISRGVATNFDLVRPRYTSWMESPPTHTHTHTHTNAAGGSAWSEARSADQSARSAGKNFRLHFSLLRMGSRGTFALCTASSRCARIAGPRAAMSFFLAQISLTNVICTYTEGYTRSWSRSQAVRFQATHGIASWGGQARSCNVAAAS